MEPLIDILSHEVAKWRENGYAGVDFPLIGDILRYQQDGESGDSLRFLRAAQLHALETYWYLRLVRKTPSIMDVYKSLYPQPHQFIHALSISLTDEEKFSVGNVDNIIAKIKDPEWAAEKGLDALHEAATLAYPGYIFALAMGAGKTVLVGAIIATEFAMARRYNGGKDDVQFMQNALVFAPGKTIIESLREIAEMPMEKILPTSALRDYQASAKIVFPRDGQKEIDVITGSRYNIIVSNTEKISLRAGAQKKRVNQTQMQFEKAAEQKKIIANARLQKIVSLPNLGVFSDEAHHTYGNDAGDAVKRVRATVNYIHDKTPLVVAVNTTGTPYYKRQMLPDVVFWYGLREGIRDNVLKSLENGIILCRVEGDDENEMLEKAIRHFFDKYKKVRLPNGAQAKIAFYFKQQEHLDESRPHIERVLAELKLPPTLVFANTQNSSKEEKDEFNRLNDPKNKRRVILLVQIGTEGWNCPSLFACALVKEQSTNIFVLQAATRCLRQTPGNDVNATVYLSPSNMKILDRGLHQNFGHGVDVINRSLDNTVREVVIERRDPQPPPVEIVREIRHFVRKENHSKVDIKLVKPKAQKKTQQCY